MNENLLDTDDCCAKQGRPKDKHKQGAILDAAAMLIVDHGFEGTSMDKVASMAGVSKQTVYSHFQNKENLFKSAIAYYSDKMISFDDLAICAHTNAKETLTQFAQAFVSLTMSEPAIAVNRLVVSNSESARKLAKLFYEAGPMVCKQNLNTLLAELNKSGQLNISNVKTATAQFISILLGEDHYLTTLGLKTSFSEKEKNKHVKDSVEAFMKIYA